jgi:ComF family protein
MCCKRHNSNGQTCEECCDKTALAGLIAAGVYEGTLRELVLGLKFQHQRAAAAPLAERVASHITQAFSSPLPFQVVTSVPTATSRLRQRGFDHAGWLARAVASHLALPYRPLLYRRSNLRQVGSSRQQRLDQAEGLFGAILQPPAAVLLIDDVTTTGATLNACAKSLTAHGTQQVWAAVAARDE